MEREVEIFVPGRLCLFGEHSDWAGKYRSINNQIVEGHAIVTGIEQGIHAYVTSNNVLTIIDNANNQEFEIEMSYEKLIEVAESGSYYSYVCGVTAYMMENYNVGGIKIVIDKITLPIKKGLSSSAACCVLVARSFNLIYNLQMSTLDEMKAAYLGENKTPSRCGKLDQACAFGQKPVSLTFDGNEMTVKKLEVGADFYWVFADLMSEKNTIKILSDLNCCYPFAQNEISKNVQLYLGKMNKEYNNQAIEYFKNGDAEKLGNLMNQVQKDFDKYVAPACKDELASPVLHSVLNNKIIKKYSYGGKGVGSQGDGTVQFLAKDAKTQKQLADYLKNELKMNSYTLTIKKTNEIKKAIIPIAGLGTRMYPMTKIMRKDFLPVYHNGLIKPAVTVLLEELYDAGIEEIYLVVDKEDKDILNELFNKELSDKNKLKLSKDMLQYDKKLKEISKIVKYVFQEEKLGLGHAVYICNEYINNEPFILLLGDQIYKTNVNKSCVEQTLESYSLNNKSIISVSSIDLNRVPNYGILSGNFKNEENSFEVSNFVEKPTVEYASQYLKTLNNQGKENYFAVFGIYILTPQIFENLKEMVDDYNPLYGEIQITPAIDKLREQEGLIAFIPDGEMFDIGTPQNYNYTWKNFNI